MKKIVCLLLCLFVLVGCNKEKDEPQVVGGWTEQKEELSDELKLIFEKADENYNEADFEVIELLATQVVAGTNYKFIAMCQQEKKIVTVYADLQGNYSITNIEDYTE